MALTIQPVAFGRNYDNASASRIAALVTNLLGDTKAEWYSDSATDMMDKAMDMASYPDTVVYLFHTTSSGEMSGLPFARVQREGVGDVKYHTLA